MNVLWIWIELMIMNIFEEVIVYALKTNSYLSHLAFRKKSFLNHYFEFNRNRNVFGPVGMYFNLNVLNLRILELDPKLASCFI